MRKTKYNIIILACVIIVILCPLSCYAHEANYLNVMVDESSNLYNSTVMSSNEFLDANHPEKKSSIASSAETATLSGETLTTNAESIVQRSSFDTFIDKMPLTFPANGGDLTQIDIDSSQQMNSILIPSLNSALLFINGTGFSNLEELSEMSKDLNNALPSGTLANGATITSGKTASISLDIEDLSDDCYVTITKDDNSKSYIWKLPKSSSYDSDVDNVSWNDCMREAWSHYLAGYTAINAATVVEPGAIEKGLASMLSGATNGLMALLGMFSIDELVFNQGVRGTSLYFYGLFPESWLPATSTLYLVFFAIGIITIFLSIGNIILRKNISVANGSMRVNVMQEVQNLVIAGLLLAFMYPLLGIVFNLSQLTTEMFANIADPIARGQFFATLSTQGNFLAGALSALVYLVISVYLNVFYIVRGVLLAALVATAPVFILMMTFGEGCQRVFTMYAKTLVATVVVQPLHAMVLGLLLAIPMNSIRGIEGLVFCACLVPVAEYIRKLVFQEAGEMASRVSHAAMGSMGSAAGFAYFTNKFVGRGAHNIGSFVDSKKTKAANEIRARNRVKSEAVKDRAARRNYNYKNNAVNSNYVAKRPVHDEYGNTVSDGNRKIQRRISSPMPGSYKNDRTSMKVSGENATAIRGARNLTNSPLSQAEKARYHNRAYDNQQEKIAKRQNDAATTSYGSNRRNNTEKLKGN